MRYHIKLKSYGDNETVIKEIPVNLQNKFSYTQTRIMTDENGFITNENFIHHPNKIFLLGDSFCECSFIRENNRLNEKVQEYINQKLNNYSVYNAGMSGSTILNMYNFLVNKILIYPKSYVLVFPGSCTAAANWYCDNFWNKFKFGGNYTDFNEEVCYDSKGDNFNNIARIIKMFNCSCKIFDINFIIVLTPRNHSYPITKFLDMLKFINNFCIDNKIPVFDLNGYIPDNDKYFYDSDHLNEVGADFYGKILSNMILEYIKGKNNCTF